MQFKTYSDKGKNVNETDRMLQQVYSKWTMSGMWVFV
jgi:hypothetical protein